MKNMKLEISIVRVFSRENLVDGLPLGRSRTIIQEYHLLCAAARRKRPERCPETSGDNRKLGKGHILDYLKRTTEHPGKIVYLIESSVRYL